jgi:hypothetical protein
LAEKQQRAEELREGMLEARRQKAQDEDNKIHEIAFINMMEGNNKRLEVLNKERDSQERLQEVCVGDV